MHHPITFAHHRRTHPHVALTPPPLRTAYVQSRYLSVYLRPLPVSPNIPKEHTNKTDIPCSIYIAPPTCGSERYYTVVDGTASPAIRMCRYGKYRIGAGGLATNPLSLTGAGGKNESDFMLMGL